MAESGERSSMRQPEEQKCTLPECLANQNRVQELQSALDSIKRSLEKGPSEAIKEILKIVNEPGVKSSLIKEQTGSNHGRLEVDFEILSKIGSGAFGQVLKVKHKIDGKEYAVKAISLARMDLDRHKQIKEAETLCRLENPHVVRYFSSWFEHNNWNASSPASTHYTSAAWSDSFLTFEKSASKIDTPSNVEMDNKSTEKGTESSESCASSNSSSSLASEYFPTEALPPMTMYIQMQFCHSNLRQAIDEGLPERPWQVWAYLQQIIAGLKFIHDRGVIHRDLKPANIFITDEQDNNFGKCSTIKIGDFGLSTNKMFASWEKTDKEGIEMTSNVGTSFYMAPEVYEKPEGVQKFSYGKASDIYSLGVIIVEMLHPFSTGMERDRILTEVCAPEVKLPSELEDKLLEPHILRFCLNHNPGSRVSLFHLPKFAVSQNLIQLLLHRGNLDRIWDSFPRYKIQFLEVHRRSSTSIVFNTSSHEQPPEYRESENPLLDGFFGQFVEYQTAVLESSKKPRILFHYKVDLQKESFTETLKRVIEAARSFKQCYRNVIEYYDGTSAVSQHAPRWPFIERIYDTLKYQNRELQLLLEEYPDFVQTWCNNSFFVCTVVKKIPFDYDRFQTELILSGSELDRQSLHASNLADVLPLLLKNAGIIDEHSFYTEFWPQYCRKRRKSVTKYLYSRLKNYRKVKGLGPYKLLAALKAFYFFPYVEQFTPPLGIDKSVATSVIDPSVKICAMDFSL